MIDIEALVFDTVYNAVIAEYPNAFISGDYIEVPSTFPHVTLIEEDNSTYKKSQDDELNEHHANLMYECNVYCNDDSKKSTAKAIANIVDSTMQGMKFVRTMRNQTPNQDRSIYRITMRYSGVVGEGITTEDNTIYQMYRK